MERLWKLRHARTVLHVRTAATSFDVPVLLAMRESRVALTLTNVCQDRAEMVLSATMESTIIGVLVALVTTATCARSQQKFVAPARV